MYVVERLVEAGVLHRLSARASEIQVPDDPTVYDGVRHRACVRGASPSEGLTISFSIHRVNREGFKAGALENGSKSLARGEYVAVFDATSF